MAQGSSENLEEFAVPDNPEEQGALKLLQYAEACKKEGILAGVPQEEEITIILEKYKQGILKCLEGVRKQRKALDNQKEGLEMQAEALAQLECTMTGTPHQPVAKASAASGSASLVTPNSYNPYTY